ncbi:MAG: J domain-containing protein [Acidobacteriota bacterium]
MGPASGRRFFLAVMTNYYEALNVRPDATEEQIEEAFRRLARRVHPDLNQDSPKAAEDRMKLLNRIRETLTDPAKRAAYDRQLAAEAADREKERSSKTRRLGRWLAYSLLVAASLGIIAVSFSILRQPPVPPPPKMNEGSDPVESPVSEPVPVRPATPPAGPKPSPSRRTQAQVIQPGSSVQEVLEVLGNPERIEELGDSGTRIFFYGRLRLVIRNGKVVQGSVGQ